MIFFSNSIFYTNVVVDYGLKGFMLFSMAMTSIKRTEIIDIFWLYKRGSRVGFYVAMDPDPYRPASGGFISSYLICGLFTEESCKLVML